ncbi:hypothetical protein V1264_008370 [Littorina saxatilis]|uniref:Cubilin-like n=1 Tax=Littorina saxatilis TaxID=31220 RepID=A0AAN9G2S3_9CAEN
MATAMVVFLLLHTVKANGCSGNVTADIVFVMDASGSVGSENFQRMREFVRDLVDALDIGPNNIRVGVQKYSSGTNTEFNLSDYYDKEDMKNATMSIVYTGGSTNTGGALSYMRTTMFSTANGDRDGVNNFGVILTDGASNDYTDTANQARAARNASITIISIGIGSGITVGELSEMASKPDSDYLFTTSGFTELSNIQTEFLAKACVAPPPVYDNCGGDLSGKRGQIVSPNYPDQYPNNSMCVWTITDLLDIHVIHVTFSQLDLENSSDCAGDSLGFRDGDNRRGSLLSRVCSDDLPSDITSTGNYMYIRFVSDGENTGTGFNVSWTLVCAKTYQSHSRNIEIPRGSGGYDCTFIIRRTQPYVIRLSFNDVHLGNDTINCTTNYIEVRDGDDENSPLLGQRYCGGTTIPDTTTSSQSMMWIRYVTDDFNQDARFIVHYIQKRPCPTVVLTERNGTFTSSLYPGNYQNDEACEWQIITETYYVIYLTFDTFDVEASSTCNYDWVDIFDDATSLGRFCGSSGPGTLKSSSHRVTVKFLSDDVYTKQGFSATYFSDCKQGLYGENCTNNCTCNLENVASCDTVNGTCTCKAGWEGVNCDDDIDECVTSCVTCPDNSACLNTAGSYICQCHTGFVRNATGVCAGDARE